MATLVTVIPEATVQATKPTERFAVVQALRGFAAFAVVWFHFTQGNTHFLPDGLLKDSGRYGWLGVEIFFVISGFVLPYSLWAGGYVSNTANYGRFLWKRISRLDPPYFASMLVVVILAYVSLLVPGFRGPKPSFSAPQLLLHVGYLNGFFGRPWLNVVYWSLAIEFQYYILIGLLFPLLSSPKRGVRIALLALLGSSAFAIPSGTYVFHYFFLFMLGFAAFFSRADLLTRWELATIGAFAAIGTAATLGTVQAIAGISTALLIAFCSAANAALVFLGEISYSLYLIHVPVGGRIINLGERLGAGATSKVAFLALATGVTIAASYAMFYFVERPCRRYAGAIRFSKLPNI